MYSSSFGSAAKRQIIHHQHVNRFVCSSPSFAAFGGCSVCNMDWPDSSGHLVEMGCSNNRNMKQRYFLTLLALASIESIGYICQVLGRWWDDCPIKDGVNFKLTRPYPKIFLSKSLSAWFLAHVVSWKPGLSKSIGLTSRYCCPRFSGARCGEYNKAERQHWPQILCSGTTFTQPIIV